MYSRTTHFLPVACGLIVCTVAVMHGSLTDSSKFVRVNSSPECVSRWVNIFDPPARFEDSFCCKAGDDPRFDQQPGFCRRSSIERILVSPAGAWALPLLPWIIPSVASVFEGGSTAWRGGKGLLCRFSSIQAKQLMGNVGLILFRTLVLYIAKNWGQNLLQGPEGNDCSYASFRRDGLCKDNWDMSDHVVLLVTHHVAIPLSEVSTVMGAWLQKQIDSRAPARNNIQHQGYAAVASVASALTIMIGAIHTLAHTTALYHSSGENLWGMLVAAVSVVLWWTVLHPCAKDSRK